ncbi:MAG: DUF1599 domain-containing protein [Cytophagales bacterium]|nr:DUF1599 domain-containing protein [Bernardetiaceae bacterium]MDW8203504.1 DUF1599 domain-containing protein [Cytophagales bacterium]
MFEQTIREYRAVIATCRELFASKIRDYGTAWRILRLPSLTDQIYIKAKRIRSIQEKGTQKINESIISEFVAMVNYGLIALMQSRYNDQVSLDLPLEKALADYDQAVAETLDLLIAKNHDYGEAWRDMRVSSITDIILMKLLRIKQIENNQGKTLVSEGVEANYRDIVNYSVYALILMGFPENNPDKKLCNTSIG